MDECWEGGRGRGGHDGGWEGQTLSLRQRRTQAKPLRHPPNPPTCGGGVVDGEAGQLGQPAGRCSLAGQARQVQQACIGDPPGACSDYYLGCRVWGSPSGVNRQVRLTGRGGAGSGWLAIS